jgi:DNA-binding response OmpR family regulator
MPEVVPLQQIERPQLKEHQVQYSDAQHLLLIDGVVLPCTPGEYNLLIPLLKHAGEPVSFSSLLGRQGRPMQALTRGIRRGLTQQMSRLRSRLWPFGLDILCLNSYGYLLLSRLDEQADEREASP